MQELYGEQKHDIHHIFFLYIVCHDYFFYAARNLNIIECSNVSVYSLCTRVWYLEARRVCARARVRAIITNHTQNGILHDACRIAYVMLHWSQHLLPWLFGLVCLWTHTLRMKNTRANFQWYNILDVYFQTYSSHCNIYTHTHHSMALCFLFFFVLL